MNGVLFYPFFNQNRLVQCYAAKLRERGVALDYICVANGKYDTLGHVNWPWYVKFQFRSLKLIPGEKLRHYYIRVFSKFLFGPIVKLYDFADFHAYYPSLYNNLMVRCSRTGVPFYIHLWGSDIMRATPEKIKQMCLGFDSCKTIELTESMIQIMQECYGSKYDEKFKICYFGNSNFEIIDELSEHRSLKIKESLYPNAEDRIILVLGYNASPSQHHDEMIQAVAELPEEYKDKLYLSLPLTYGAQPGYVDKIRGLLNNTNIEYRIFDTFLANEEMAVLRKTADIVLNLQDSDAIAGSLQEHLYCGGVCIIGEWLNYIPYDRNGVFYIKTGRKEIASYLLDVINHLDAYKEQCSHNHDVLKSIFSWDSTIDNFVQIYGK